jgi:hypothetical protein
LRPISNVSNVRRIVWSAESEVETSQRFSPLPLDQWRQPFTDREWLVELPDQQRPDLR